jgi:Ca2+-binding RTX toxin-like protein
MPLPIEGTNAAEVINLLDGVTNGNDIIWAYGGNDTISGLGGDDQIKGGGGADSINGGLGSDTAVYIDSTSGVTVSLLTGSGAGGTAQGDTLTSIENLWGSNHNDMLIGNGSSNALTGANGNDTLKGGGGADNLDGGGGTDTVSYYYSTEGVVASIFFGWFSGGEAQGDTLTSIENLTGSGYDDTLGGTNGANTLSGLNGDDYLKGFGGNDILNGGAGEDVMEGGTGNDTYYVDDAADEVVEAAGQGSDTVLASTDYALAEGVDVETLATTNANGTADLVLWGNSSGNSIIGNNGDNILKGGGGTDQLTGRGGNDIYFVDGSEDDIVETGGQGIDEVWASANYVLNEGADVELLRTTNDLGMDNIRLTGNSSGNIVRGNAGNNRINGGDGNDELTGLGGEDIFLFGYGSTFDGATNIDFVTDFEVINDTIWLDPTVFTGIDAGALPGDAFVNGAAAQDAEDRIIYNGATGALYYDSDGLGGADAIQFAVLSPGLALSNANFVGVLPF